MKLEELTIKEVREIQAMFSNQGQFSKPHPYVVGEKYLIRTVTHYYTGQLTSVYDNELVLDTAAWIPDTGRFYDAIKTGNVNEVEPIIGPLIVGRGAIVDVIEWKNVLPCSQK